MPFIQKEYLEVIWNFPKRLNLELASDYKRKSVSVGTSDCLHISYCKYIISATSVYGNVNSIARAEKVNFSIFFYFGDYLALCGLA